MIKNEYDYQVIPYNLKETLEKVKALENTLGDIKLTDITKSLSDGEAFQAIKGENTKCVLLDPDYQEEMLTWVNGEYYYPLTEEAKSKYFNSMTLLLKYLSYHLYYYSPLKKMYYFFSNEVGEDNEEYSNLYIVGMLPKNDIPDENDIPPIISLKYRIRLHTDFNTLDSGYYLRLEGVKLDGLNNPYASEELLSEETFDNQLLLEEEYNEF